MNYLANKTFDKIKIGDTAKLTHVLNKRDIQLFAIMSGDVNPAHVNPEYAKHDIFHAIVGHGMWTGALISTVIGTKLPGPGTIYLSQSLKFTRPVTIGDKITVKVMVIKKYVRKPILILNCICHNQKKKIVVTGIAKVLAPTEKVRLKRTKLPKAILRNTK